MDHVTELITSISSELVTKSAKSQKTRVQLPSATNMPGRSSSPGHFPHVRRRGEKEQMISEIPFVLKFYSIHKNPTEIHMASEMEKSNNFLFKTIPWDS